MRTAVVVPTNRPERMAAFCSAWEKQFNVPDVRLIVVEDNPTFTPDVVPEWAEHYYWGNYQDMLPAVEAVRCIPQRSGGCRDFGFWLAGHDESIEMVVSLDDDVAPVGDQLLSEHWTRLEWSQMSRWFSPTPFACRGLPYRVRDGETAVLNHGLWSGVPDVDAFAQLQRGESPWELGEVGTRQVPPGQYYPMSIMNVAWRREYTPYMWMPSLPEGYKRWDDIWCGLVFKRVADLYGWPVVTGEPIVHHTRASSIVNNLRQEMLGYGIHEELWKVVDCVHKQESALDTWLLCWQQVGQAFPQLAETARLARIWAGLWRGAQ